MLCGEYCLNVLYYRLLSVEQKHKYLLSSDEVLICIEELITPRAERVVTVTITLAPVSLDVTVKVCHRIQPDGDCTSPQEKKGSGQK